MTNGSEIALLSSFVTVCALFLFIIAVGAIIAAFFFVLSHDEYDQPFKWLLPLISLVTFFAAGTFAIYLIMNSFKY